MGPFRRRSGPISAVDSALQGAGRLLSSSPHTATTTDGWHKSIGYAQYLNGRIAGILRYPIRGLTWESVGLGAGF